MLKIKMVASQATSILTVGAKPLALRRSMFVPETQEFLDGDIFTVDADAVLTAVCCWLAVSQGKL